MSGDIIPIDGHLSIVDKRQIIFSGKSETVMRALICNEPGRLALIDSLFHGVNLGLLDG